MAACADKTCWQLSLHHPSLAIADWTAIEDVNIMPSGILRHCKSGEQPHPCATFGNVGSGCKRQERTPSANHLGLGVARSRRLINLQCEASSCATSRDQEKSKVYADSSPDVHCLHHVEQARVTCVNIPFRAGGLALDALCCRHQHLRTLIWWLVSSLHTRLHAYYQEDCLYNPPKIDTSLKRADASLRSPTLTGDIQII
jgi:hypothetical protein